MLNEAMSATTKPLSSSEMIALRNLNERMITVGQHPEAAHKRETREWWAVTDMHDVVRVTGFSCAPNSPTTWWVPSLGYSMSEKHHLFEKERDALEQAMRELVIISDNANKQLAALMARMRAEIRKGTP